MLYHEHKSLNLVGVIIYGATNIAFCGSIVYIAYLSDCLDRRLNNDTQSQKTTLDEHVIENIKHK